jgi:hypothetical protein
VREAALVGGTGVAFLAAYWKTFAGYLPNAAGGVGHDYALFLPRLLAGYFWFEQNGIGAVPWFTPAFCGGMPFLANPPSNYYSVPQFLTFVIEPLAAVRVTFALFAVLGFGGMWALLRRGFALGPGASLFGAVAFGFNGFYAYRMLAGHLTFHSFMLLPLASFWLVRPAAVAGGARVLGHALDAVLGGIAFAYMFQSGYVHGVLPSAIAVCSIALLHGIARGGSWSVPARIAGAGVVALLLCAAKLVAGLLFTESFARTGYPLPGADGVGNALRLALQSLFLRPAHELVPGVVVNSKWNLKQHEFEFGVTPVVAAVLLVGALAALWRLIGSAEARRALVRQGPRVLGLGALLALPIALNVYTPEWNALLKRVPMLGSSSSLFRLFSAYVPVVVVIAAIVVDRGARPRWFRVAVPAVLVALTVAFHVAADRRFYDEGTWDPVRIREGYRRARANGTIPAITEAFEFTDARGAVWMPRGRNEVMVDGRTQISCYETLFGYRLEWFPRKQLRNGPSLSVVDGVLNVKNPACYTYGKVNGCEPGDHFPPERRADAEAFLSYRPFPFIEPASMTVAGAVNLAALGIVVAFLLAVTGGRLVQRRRRR